MNLKTFRGPIPVAEKDLKIETIELETVTNNKRPRNLN